MNLESKISVLLSEWNEIKLQLIQLFEMREQKNVPDLMKKGINVYHQFLHLSNDRLVAEETTNFNVFQWKPVNLEERLTFIRKRPNLYHSFIQLTELVAEQEKQFKKKMAIEKMAKQ